MLRDDTFSSRAKVDRYGRRLPKDAGKKELERYYRIKENQERPVHDIEVESELERANSKLGDEGFSSSTEISSSEDDDGSDVSNDEEVFGLLDGQDANGEGIPIGEVTSRLAVVNLDWDNIRVEDLMAVFSSFTQHAGQIKKISVYPSDFGRERMEKEEMEGPPKEIFTGRKDKINGERLNQDDSETDDEVDEASSAEDDDENIKKSLLQEDTGQDFDSAKLRRYQLERLRYYYAVLVCSSSSVAQRIYEAVDGTEYLTTANFFDLRFIPNDVSFSADKPRDECTQIPDGYRPNEFVTDALQHSKVKLTWDAEDGTRKEVQKRAFAASRANIDQNDLKAYLGSDSSDDDGDALEPIVVDATTDIIPHNGQPSSSGMEAFPKVSKKEVERQRMRALLGLDFEPNAATPTQKPKSGQSVPVGDMQITFASGLTSTDNKNSVFTNSPDNHEETTVEKYVRKEKERKARRKSKLKALQENGRDDKEASVGDPASYNDNLPHRESLQPHENKHDLGFSDPFFTNPDSANPTAPPKTAAERKEAKRLQKAQRTAEEAASAAQRAELELLTMPDDDAANENAIQHFNMKEILRAERAIAKSKKSKKKNSKASEREKEALKMKEQDRFKVDVEDPRFDAVFERPEFAIDPSHPRFLGTGGMKEILDEGRRKRRRREDKGEDADVEIAKKRVKRKEEEKGSREEDVEKLVERIKGKSKKRAVPV
ncbi:MAG: hypothetical protein L6R41_005943 [Letrouitia leprolyta]|nr:MAG: hypothetical protein L6R41_005943 [Letrouitia leprolyta]